MPQRATKFNKAQQALYNCLKSNVLKINDLRKASAMPWAQRSYLKAYLVDFKGEVDSDYPR
jgi:hypothetical protein